MNKEQFIDAVDKVCSDCYEVEDGGDLCYNLMEQDVITMSMGVDLAAQVVAQHVQQA